jgi:phosphopantothenoylcysteine decarboxylase/phosphopantothenate--cysteine ligase
VTGSIAAYKAADMASKLTQAGALVDVILTQAARRFISELTFQSLTGRQAYIDDDLWGAQSHVIHVGLARDTDIFVVAPATATTIAKLALGSAEDLLSLTALALGTQNAPPLLIAPAMDAGMYQHQATQENLKKLEQRGAIIVGPEEGHLASGLVAKGRMTEPAELFGHLRYILSRGGRLDGKRVVVTAGGTQEPLDPVRVLTNLSSGKQGFALAQAALDLGAEVVLIAPTGLRPKPIGVELIDATTSSDMESAVLRACQNADVLLMAAAVSDFRPAQTINKKIKKGLGIPELRLEPTADILKAVSRQREEMGTPEVVVGFAAESEDLIENAQEKLKDKNLDLIAANDILASDSGFGVDTNRVTLLSADGEIETLALMTKFEVAQKILERVITILEA